MGGLARNFCNATLSFPSSALFVFPSFILDVPDGLSKGIAVTGVRWTAAWRYASTKNIAGRKTGDCQAFCSFLFCLGVFVVIIR